MSTKDDVKELYITYMEMIRAFVSEGIIEVDEPTPKQLSWAHRAALGDSSLEKAFALLARVSQQAFKQRYLEGMPMLIDVDSMQHDPHNGFESVERFHFLKFFAKDVRALQNAEEDKDLPGVSPALYMQPQTP